MIWMSKARRAVYVQFEYSCPDILCSPLDQQWLDAMNQDRVRERQPRASYEIFEVIMDRLEKEWFELVRILAIPHRVSPRLPDRH